MTDLEAELRQALCQTQGVYEPNLYDPCVEIRKHGTCRTVGSCRVPGRAAAMARWIERERVTEKEDGRVLPTIEERSGSCDFGLPQPAPTEDQLVEVVATICAKHGPFLAVARCADHEFCARAILTALREKGALR
jgi:hypothetical protein